VSGFAESRDQGSRRCHKLPSICPVCSEENATVAQGAPELVVFVQTAFGNEEGGMSCSPIGNVAKRKTPPLTLIAS
jgi:hypothetical protein